MSTVVTLLYMILLFAIAGYRAFEQQMRAANVLAMCGIAGGVLLAILVASMCLGGKTK